MERQSKRRHVEADDVARQFLDLEAEVDNDEEEEDEDEDELSE